MDELMAAIEQLTIKVDSLMSTRYKLVYTTHELATALHTNDDKINMFRHLGAIKGIKKGKEFIYEVETAKAFLKDFEGYELSNEKLIRQAVAQVNAKKMASDRQCQRT